jgi:hypothetical protein
VSIPTSQEVNSLAVADIDADGRDDLFIMGSLHYEYTSEPRIFFGDDSGDKFTSEYPLFGGGD